jgi:pyruvate dehydrogenase E2 component (dihydrolipoamide acetyltransferase)
MDKKLLITVIRNTNTKTIVEISKEIDSLINRAKNNQLTPNELTGATFTVSNLGMCGITPFVPIVNPGEGAILGVGTLQKVPRVTGNTVSISRVIEFTLVCDHRSVDGVAGANFCQEFKKIMESEEVKSW